MEAIDTRQTLYTTLLLLEFDPVALGNKYRTVNFDKDMFNFPNMHAIEEVLYHLLNKLDHASCLKEFRDCWPLHDKKQEQEFRRIASNWLEKIAKNDIDSHLPRMIPLPTSPYGEKVYMYFLCLSRYVLHKLLISKLNKTCYQDFIGHPTETTDSDKFIKMITTLISKVKARYISRTMQTVEIKKKWQSTMEMFIKSYRDDVKIIQELKTKLLERQTTEEDEVPVDDDKASKVCGMIGKLEEFRKNVESKKDIFESHFDGSVGKYVIDGKSINIALPNQLVQEREEDAVKKKVNSVETDGKLDILNVIKLWNISLKQCCETLEQGGMPNMKDFNSKSELILDKIKSSVDNFSKMSNNMSNEILPDLQNSIEQLLRRARDNLLSNRTPETFVIPSLGASGLSPLKKPSLRTCQNISFDIKLPNDSDEEEVKMSKLIKQIDEGTSDKIDATDDIDLNMKTEPVIDDIDEESKLFENISKKRRTIVDEKYLVSSVKKTPKPKPTEVSHFKRPTLHVKKPSVNKKISSLPTSANIRDRLNAIKKTTTPQATKENRPLKNDPIALQAIDDDHLDWMADKVVNQFINMMSDDQSHHDDDDDVKEFIKGLATPIHPVCSDELMNEGFDECHSTLGEDFILNVADDDGTTKNLEPTNQSARLKDLEALQLRRMTAIYKEIHQTQTPKISGRTRHFRKENEVVEKSTKPKHENILLFRNKTEFAPSFTQPHLQVLREDSFIKSSSSLASSFKSKRCSGNRGSSRISSDLGSRHEDSKIEGANKCDDILSFDSSFRSHAPPLGRRLSKSFQGKADMEDVIFSPRKNNPMKIDFEFHKIDIVDEIASSIHVKDSSLLDLDGFDDTNFLN